MRLVGLIVGSILVSGALEGHSAAAQDPPRAGSPGGTASAPSPIPGGNARHLQAGRPFDVTLGVVVQAFGDNVLVEGATSLPPGTRLRMSLGGGGRIFERDTTVGEGGRFAFPLVPAPYGADYGGGVTMLDPSLQPSHVRRLVGERGERMRGASVTMLGGTIPLVSHDFQFRR